MSENRGCPECGASVPPDSPAGLCPRCLMGAAFSATGTFKPPAGPPGAPSPAGPPVDLAEYRRAVLDLGLVPPGELDRLTIEAAVDATGLARALVRAGRLTGYQARAIAQGKARGLAIGPYLVLEKRGQGGMGVVFKAKHRESGRVVALKILLPSFGRDREAVLRFRREFEVAARLGHPNIVAALEASEDRGVQFLTMEYVEGHDLEDLVREVGPLPIKMSTHCAIQAARGLAAAHARGIVHRDVKPGNLMLDPTGAVRVLDLGLARIVEAAGPMAGPKGHTLTRTGVYMGTVDFIAPEQADDSKKATAQADIYSLGCTLYFLLAGRPPFEGDTVLQRLMAHQQRPAPSLHAARDDVPEALESAYRAMMAKRPADRPGSMAEVIGLLEACRATADEAREARAGLRTFAETVMKRASPRVRDRSPDASVFARRAPAGGLQFDPDLDLEDLVMDYRDEVKPAPLDEDLLPPPPPRVPRPRRRRRRAGAPGLALGVALLGFALAAYLLIARARGPAAGPPPVASRSPGGPAGPVATAPDPFAPLLGASGLSGWSAEGGRIEDWQLAGGVLTGRGHGDPKTRLVSRRAYSDVIFRADFQLEQGASGGILLQEAGPGRTGAVLVQLGGADPWGETGGVRRLDDDGKGTLTRPVNQAKLKPGDPWDSVELDFRGGLCTVSINGSPVNHWTGLDNLPGPRRVGFQAYRGAIRFRNVEALGPDRSSPSTWPPRTLYVDEFDKKWSKKHGASLEGQAGGVYFFDVNEPAWWGWDCPPYGLPDSIAVEAVGRVLGDAPENLGSWGLQVVTGEGRGFQARIDNRGGFFVEPSSWSAAQHPDDPPRTGAIVHPAIRPAGQANTLLLRIRRGRVEALVNGASVYQSGDLDWLRDLHVIRKGIFGEKGRVRLEFDRIEVRDLPGPPAAGASARAPAAPPPAAARSAPGRILYTDDFSDPASEWGRGEEKVNNRPTGVRRDYEGGIYFIQAGAGWSGASAWDMFSTGTKPPGDYQVEAVGRVLGDGPGAVGAWGLILTNPESRGLEVKIDRHGAVYVEPAFWGVGKFPDDPSLGPIAHPATKAGKEWNTLTLRVRRRRLEVLVNGVAVSEPRLIDWDLTPAMAQITVFKPLGGPGVRAEFDRVEARELAVEPPKPR